MEEMTTHQYAKHVRIICDLKPGDIVRTDNWGPKFDGKDHVVESVEFKPHFQSGFMVSLVGIGNKFDSSWLIKKQ
jgi:hypothetical protein